MASIITVNNVPVPSVPVPSDDPKSLQEAVAALKANVEVLTGATAKLGMNTGKSDVRSQLDLARRRHK